MEAKNITLKLTFDIWNNKNEKILDEYYYNCQETKYAFTEKLNGVSILKLN